MVAARVKIFHAEKAKQRQKRKPKDSVVENLPQQNNGKARDHAGAALHVSGKSVDAATEPRGGIAAANATLAGEISSTGVS